MIHLVEELQERVATLKGENERLREENERLQSIVGDRAETIDTLKARLER